LVRPLVIPFPLPIADELKELARERMADGMIVEAQLAAEAGARLRELWQVKSTGQRARYPSSREMIDLPSRLRDRGGVDRDTLWRAAIQIETVERDIMGLPSPTAPRATLSPLMRTYLLDGAHPGNDSTFAGLEKRGLVAKATWNAPLTDLGLQYVWGHCERRLDKALSPKQRQSMPILRSEAELSIALRTGSLKTFRDHHAVALPHEARQRSAVLHPFLVREMRLGNARRDAGSPVYRAIEPDHSRKDMAA
jgi:hypothetical protein